jgi:hypothetical protein
MTGPTPAASIVPSRSGGQISQGRLYHFWAPAIMTATLTLLSPLATPLTGWRQLQTFTRMQCVSILSRMRRTICLEANTGHTPVPVLLTDRLQPSRRRSGHITRLQFNGAGVRRLTESCLWDTLLAAEQGMIMTFQRNRQGTGEICLRMGWNDWRAVETTWRFRSQRLRSCVAPHTALSSTRSDENIAFASCAFLGKLGQLL